MARDDRPRSGSAHPHKGSSLKSIFRNWWNGHERGATEMEARTERAGQPVAFGAVQPFPASSKWQDDIAHDPIVAPNLKAMEAPLKQPIVWPVVCREGAQSMTVGISIQGSSHVRNDVQCQDSFVTWESDTAGCIVVCDGAGSPKYRRSREGAEILSKHVAEGFRIEQKSANTRSEDGARAIVHKAITLAYGAMKKFNEANEGDLTPKDFSCTLVGVFWNNDGHVAFHIGDGLAVIGLIQSDNGKPIPISLSHPKNGEFSDQTFFFPTYETDLQIQVGGPIQFACVMSDGVQELMYSPQKRTIHKGFMEPVLIWMRDGNAKYVQSKLLNGIYNENANAKSDDDKTMVIWTRKPMYSVKLVDRVYENASAWEGI